MKRLLTLLSLLLPIYSFACSCTISTLTEAALKSHSYVALVGIKEQLPFDEAKYSNRERIGPVQYEVLIDEIALFKGASIQKIIVNGAPPQSKTIMTSCDMNVAPGQEWLIIANVSPGGSVSIHMCGHSMLYRDKDGFRDWQYSSAMQWVRLAGNILSGSPLPPRLDTDKPVLFYPNGQIERKVNYKNNKKHGTSLFYYPDGTVYGRVEYRKDSLHGNSIWYDRKGHIQSKSTYRMGTPVDSMITYMYPNAPMFVSIRSRKGVIQKSQLYQGSFETPTSSYLYEETLYTKGEQSSSTYYREDGTVKYRVKYHALGSTELTYDESGKLIKTREFDKKGKLLSFN